MIYDADMSRTVWINLPQGRIRYTGSALGRDEPSIQTFAVEFDGKVYYGEIETIFLSDRHNFNLEIISFGWLKKEWCGSLPEPEQASAFTESQLKIIQEMICQAVKEWRQFKLRPSFITEFDDSHFMGDIIFHEGWALVKDEGVKS